MKYTTGLSTSFLRQYIDKTPPWGPVGYVTYKRTYARLIPDLGRTEEWHETCARVCHGLLDLGGLFTERELEDLYDTLFHLRGMTSGRALWQLGSETVRRVGADSLQNCWHVVVNNVESFCFTFNQLMLGGGVGFNILPEHVYELPPVKHHVVVKRVDTADCDFVVPDNREGWVELLRRILNSLFVTGKPFLYSTECIRPAGSLIKGFGGTASGSESLVKGLEQIVKIIQARAGQKLRPIDCMDVMNIIGQIVVAGNVRRSSEIAIGDPQDRLFIEAKNWSKYPIPNWRTMSNNSVAADSMEDLLPEFWSGYRGEGEPYGLINLKNCRRYGRLIDGIDYRPDYDVVGVNPCAEITLCNKEPCNLADIFLPNLRSAEEMKKVAVLLYKACKTISRTPFSDPDTQSIVGRNTRVGIGLTGYMQAPQFHDGDILDSVYRAIEEADLEYSMRLGCKRSIKLTTMKPSGTLSLLPGVTPGMHAAFAPFLIRRIRFSATDPLVETCRQHGFHVEPKLELDGSHDTNTMVVSFPWAMPKNAIFEQDVNVIQELEVQKHLQTYWADNSISATHYFKKGELGDIKNWLNENYESSVKTCSFLLSQGHGFAQAPLEAISEEKYVKLMEKVTPITRITDEREMDHVDNLECAGGSCPVK